MESSKFSAYVGEDHCDDLAAHQVSAGGGIMFRNNVGKDVDLDLLDMFKCHEKTFVVMEPINKTDLTSFHRYLQKVSTV